MRNRLDWILVLTLLLAPAPSFAQTFGQITGIVTDSTGACSLARRSLSRIRKPASPARSRPTARAFTCFPTCSRACTT